MQYLPGNGGYQGGSSLSLHEGPGKTEKVEGCQQRASLWVAVGRGPLAFGGRLVRTAERSRWSWGLACW